MTQRKLNPWVHSSGESWAGDIQKTSATNGVRLRVATKMTWLRIKTKDYTKYTINNNVLLLFTSPCLLSSPFFHLPGLPRYCPDKMNHLLQSTLIKLASTFSSSNSLKDLVSLAVLFIHWQTMGEQIINPRCHSHHSSTNVSEFFLSFSPHTLSSCLLFWGHTTPLKKNIKELAGRLFLMDIKNILWQQMLTIQSSLLDATHKQGNHSHTNSLPNLFICHLIGDRHSPFLWTHLSELCKFHSQCSIFSNCWLIESSSISTSTQCFLSLTNCESTFCIKSNYLSGELLILFKMTFKTGTRIKLFSPSKKKKYSRACEGPISDTLKQVIFCFPFVNDNKKMMKA